MAAEGQGVYRGERFKAYIVMDSMDKILLYMETGQRPTLIEEGEPTEIYDAIDDLRKDTYRFCTYYAAIYEYRRPKLVRTSQHQTTEDVDIDY